MLYEIASSKLYKNWWSLCMNICMYIICMYVSSMCVCVYICMSVYMHVYMLICLFVCMYVRLYVCMYVCMYVGMYVIRLYGSNFYVCLSPDLFWPGSKEVKCLVWSCLDEQFSGSNSGDQAISPFQTAAFWVGTALVLTNDQRICSIYL